jgi:Protein of unknown function (DUF2510)
VNSTETPGGSGIPAGWYDDPSGPGLRWWDGDQWTEHVHSAESAAAATGAGTTTTAGGGSREGAPPRDLVKLREWIRGRGSKGLGLVLGAVVVVIVAAVLLLSGGSDNDGSGGPGPSVPAAGQVTPGGPTAKAARQEIKQINKQLKGKSLPKAAKKQLQVQKKQLEKVTAGGKSGSAKKGTGKSGKKKVAPGEEGS